MAPPSTPTRPTSNSPAPEEARVSGSADRSEETVPPVVPADNEPMLIPARPSASGEESDAASLQSPSGSTSPNLDATATPHGTAPTGTGTSSGLAMAAESGLVYQHLVCSEPSSPTQSDSLLSPSGSPHMATTQVDADLPVPAETSYIATPASSYPPSLHSRSSAPLFPSFPRRAASGTALATSTLGRTSVIAPAGPDSDIVFTRSDHLPDYGDVPSKPPSYLAVQERDARNSFDGHLVHDHVPTYVTLGLFGGCIPSIGPLKVGTLRFVTMVYLVCTVVATLSFTILEITMMRDFTHIFRVPVTPSPDFDVSDPRLEPDVDPLPLVHLVLNAIWCPSALMAFVLLSQEVVLGYRIAVHIVYFCLCGEVFTTVLQSANRATQVSRGANNLRNDHAQRVLNLTISIRTALLPLHLVGAWVVYWTAKLLPNSMETAAMVARRRRIRTGQRVPGWHPDLMEDEDVSVATARANAASADARSIEATSAGPWHWPV
ncbi:hypothetical protein BCR44DRAFT_36071 [Catenaria anguillulae PL171]|uniref:Uncharacterized protein n=1 Tax=Catenaria anguillulae PL171 TaxID=765915 RepID=A0A1Y2I0H3_9FUNG|nr:hypothetical protein BCR44DRAFT_36071 [Catenaria anguillulae PL171]